MPTIGTPGFRAPNAHKNAVSNLDKGTQNKLVFHQNNSWSYIVGGSGGAGLIAGVGLVALKFEAFGSPQSMRPAFFLGAIGAACGALLGMGAASLLGFDSPTEQRLKYSNH